MAHPEFLDRQKTPEQFQAHVAEEAVEVLQAAFNMLTAHMKQLRFGPDSVNPLLPKEQQVTNAAKLDAEIDDLEGAIKRYKERRSKPEYENYISFGKATRTYEPSKGADRWRCEVVIGDNNLLGYAETYTIGHADLPTNSTWDFLETRTKRSAPIRLTGLMDDLVAQLSKHFNAEVRGPWATLHKVL